MIVLPNGPRHGAVVPPPSKSHLHRLLIAAFLAGDRSCLAPAPDDSDDVLATRRCLAALASPSPTPELDAGESGSTYRFLRPLAAALGKSPCWILRGRLAARPDIPYPALAPGLHELPGDVSSQFATGLLFALPLLPAPSEIRFASPLQSRGYVDLTLSVLAASGIVVRETPSGFLVPAPQTYRLPPSLLPERDWSGAAFWLAMNAIGSRIDVQGLSPDSAQPDRRIVPLLAQTGGDKDMSQCPDIFPPLAVAAAAVPAVTRFTGVRRLRLKESNRLASVADLLTRLGVPTEETDDTFTVRGTSSPFPGGVEIQSYGDHRIAMSAAVAATRAAAPLTLDNPACAAKSYPTFFADFSSLAPL